MTWSSARLAQVNLHVAADNYGLIEDSHAALLHVMAQYLRMEGIADDAVLARVKF